MVSTASVVGRSVVDACSVGNGSAPEKIPGLFSHAITAGSPAVRVPPCQGGSGFGDDPCDRRGYSPGSWLVWQRWFGWPDDAHHRGQRVGFDQFNLLGGRG